MADPLLFELVGYAASALLILSLTRRSIFRLRAIGLLSAAVFFIYSLLIEAYPIAVVNIIVAAIHIYFLLKLTRRPDEIFSLLRVDPDSTYLRAFLDFHRKDIRRFQPDFEGLMAASPDPLVAVFVLRDMVPAALFVGRIDDEGGIVEVLLDYAIPQYRDFRLGKFLYSDQSRLFGESRYRLAVATAVTEEHATYLQRVGFVPIGGDRYTRTLD